MSVGYNDSMDLKQKFEELVKNRNFKPNLMLGQHFMIDQAAINKMVQTINKNTVVIEIGPGFGQLTSALAVKAGKVIAIEIDNRFRKSLLQIKKKHKNVEIIFGDALLGFFDTLVSKEVKSHKPVRIVSNLPYHVTEPFIKKIVNLTGIRLILTVGKKSGYQLQLTDPSDLNFTQLSYVCRSFYTVKKIADLPKEAFWPVPKTDSVILELIPKKVNSRENVDDFIGQKIIHGQKHGALIKNVLMSAFINLKELGGVAITKNQSRAIVNSLDVSDELLNKSFSQLDNNEVRVLATSITKVELTTANFSSGS